MSKLYNKFNLIYLFIIFIPLNVLLAENITSELVKSVEYYPQKTYLNINDRISFHINSNDKYDLNDLEFKIWVYKNGRWKVFQEFRKLPIKEYKTAEEGTIAIQIDIRHKKINKLQKIWLNNFDFYKDQRSILSLYKFLLINSHFMNEKEFIETISRELYLILKIIYYKKNNRKTFLKKIIETDEYYTSSYKENKIFFSTDKGKKYVYDINTGMMEFSKTKLKLSLDIFAREYYELFKIEDYNLSNFIALGIFNAIFHGIDYGVPSIQYGGAKALIGSCNTNSKNLYNIYNALDFDVQYIGFDIQELSHLIISLNVSELSKFILDPTVGIFYKNNIKELICNRQKLQEFYLAGNRKLDYLRIDNLLKKEGKNIFLSNSVKTNINNKFNVSEYIMKNNISYCKE